MKNANITTGDLLIDVVKVDLRRCWMGLEEMYIVLMLLQ